MQALPFSHRGRGGGVGGGGRRRGHRGGGERSRGVGPRRPIPDQSHVFPNFPEIHKFSFYKSKIEIIESNESNQNQKKHQKRREHLESAPH